MATYQAIGQFLLSGTIGTTLLQDTNVDTTFVTNGVRIGQSAVATIPVNPSAPDVWFHFAWFTSFGNGGTPKLIPVSIYNTSGDRLMAIRGDGGVSFRGEPLTIEAYNGVAGTVVGTLFAGAGMNNGTLYMMDIHITSGSFEIYIDGVLNFSVSGLSQPVANIDRCELRPNHNAFVNANAQHIFSEAAVGIGANSSTVGMRVSTRFPTGNGFHTGVWGTSGFGNVDDGAVLNDGVFATSNTAGQRSSYTFPAHPGNIPIEAVAIRSSALHNSAGVQDYQHFLRIGGTDYDQAALAPTATLGSYGTTLTTSPATGLPFGVAEYTGMQIGILSA